MTKKFISIIISIIMCMCMISSVTGSAKVIEPEIVKTESWTTSYYIDDNTETLYPYIQCEADIYNDGTIKLYMWNTHEWDGFATVSHKICINNTFLYPSNSPQCSVKYGGQGYVNGKPCNCYTNDDIENIDVSYYPEQYSVIAGGEECLYYICNYSPKHESLATVQYDNSGFLFSETISIPSWTIPLAKIPAYTSRPEKNYSQTKLTPKEDPTGTYKFRLYGHDITITPELLSGNIISEPELTEQEKYIKQLEEENKLIKQELEVYKNCDSDNDGMFTANDAQTILNYYGEYLSGNVSGKVEDYGDFVSGYVNTDNTSKI